MTGRAVLAVDELTVRFGSDAVVRGVSFEIAAGSRLAIVGESGSGKTSLALAVLGLVDPPGTVAAGHIRVDDLDLTALDDRAFAAVRGNRIGFVVQDPMNALDPTRTVGSQIVDSLRRHQAGLGRAAARRIAERLLAEVEIRDAAGRLDHYPWQFSGGMLQRVVIAIALANEPDLLIADEPTTALDVATADQILRLLDRVSNARGLAVMLITHNLGLVEAFCTDVLVLYDGQAMEQGSVAEVFAQPFHPYTAALMASIPRADWPRDRPLATIPGSPPRAGGTGPGCSFAPRCQLSRGRQLCTSVVPVPRPIDPKQPGRLAACHFAEELAPTDGAS